MVRLVQPHTELAERSEQARCLRNDFFEEHHAGRKIRRRHHSNPGLGSSLTGARFVFVPSGRSDDDIDAAFGESLQIGGHRVGR